MIITVFGRIIRRIEAYYKTSLLLHKCDKLEKVRELFQVSRRLNHIVQEVTLCLKGAISQGRSKMMNFCKRSYQPIQWRSKLDNWGGGAHIHIYISNEINCAEHEYMNMCPPNY